MSFVFAVLLLVGLVSPFLIFYLILYSRLVAELHTVRFTVRYSCGAIVTHHPLPTTHRSPPSTLHPPPTLLGQSFVSDTLQGQGAINAARRVLENLIEDMQKVFNRNGPIGWQITFTQLSLAQLLAFTHYTESDTETEVETEGETQQAGQQAGQQAKHAWSLIKAALDDEEALQFKSPSLVRGFASVFGEDLRSIRSPSFCEFLASPVPSSSSSSSSQP